MKSIEIKASLPFSWCRFCTRMDLETRPWIANGQVEEIENVCTNDAVCEACERARAKNITTADPEPVKVTWVELDERGVQIQGEQIRGIGVVMGAGADQTGGISNGEYLRRVLPGMTDETLRNIFACKATCSDCPMEEQCRNCIDKRHRGEKTPDLTCGDRWELWLKEAVK